MLLQHILKKIRWLSCRGLFHEVVLPERTLINVITIHYSSSLSPLKMQHTAEQRNYYSHFLQFGIRIAVFHTITAENYSSVKIYCTGPRVSGFCSKMGSVELAPPVGYAISHFALLRRILLLQLSFVSLKCARKAGCLSCRSKSVSLLVNHARLAGFLLSLRTRSPSNIGIGRRERWGGGGDGRDFPCHWQSIFRLSWSSTSW